MSITRLFFFRLTEAVQDGYRTGSALGIAQQLRSVQATPFATFDECRAATETELLKCVRLIPIGGIHAAESFQRLKKMLSRVMVLATAWPILLVLANNNEWIRSNLGAFIANVSASIVAAILMLLAPKAVAWVHSGQSK
jgi:hypothetical protein